MAKRGDPNVLRLVVIFLRALTRMTQAEFGRASGIDQGDISRYEQGDLAPPEASLRRMARAAKVPWPLVLLLIRFIETFLAAVARRRSPIQVLDPKVLEPALQAVTTYLLEDAGTKREQPPEEARREADETWRELERHDISRRRRLIEMTPQSSKSPALAMRICEASAQAADRNAGESLELAELAFSIAERVQGEESGRVQGYCRERLLHARQVAAELGGAG
jgi:transcriptional regulator with XRE-family HTH domain